MQFLIEYIKNFSLYHSIREIISYFWPIRSNEISFNLKLLAKQFVNHNSGLFTFAIQKNLVLLVRPGQHLNLHANIDSSIVKRNYTPLPRSTCDTITLLIKNYPNGKMSNYIFNLGIGFCIRASGPFGLFVYNANNFNSIGLIAGGTGITPIFQIMNVICENKFDNTHPSLMYANISEEDILLKKEIDEVVSTNTSRGFTVYYTIDKPIFSNWKGGIGYITKESMIEHLPALDKDKTVWIACGPPQMMKSIKNLTNEICFELGLVSKGKLIIL